MQNRALIVALIGGMFAGGIIARTSEPAAVAQVKPAADGTPLIRFRVRVPVTPATNPPTFTTRVRWFRADDIAQVQEATGPHEGHSVIVLIEPYNSATIVQGQPAAIAQAWSSAVRRGILRVPAE